MLLYRQRSPPMGWVAWRKCKRTPDMGCALGMGDLVLLKVTIYGSAACQEHERTPDMGRGAGMVRPDAPQRSPSMGVPRAKSMKGPQIWDTEPGWYGLIPPKGHHLWDARPTGLRPAACWPLLGWGLPPRPPWRWTPPPPAPSRRLPHPACHQGNRTLRGPAVLVVFQDGG